MVGEFCEIFATETLFVTPALLLEEICRDSRIHFGRRQLPNQVLEFGTLLSGAVLTEQVFTIPGFGKLIVDSVFNRDYAVVQGVVLVTATAYITLNLLADIAYFAANPKLRG